MPAEITMPQLSDTMTEGVLVKWHKKEGDTVKSAEVIADIETDKATMEFESSEPGTLAHLAAVEGQTVPVGAIIAVVATSGEDAKAVKAQYASGTVESAGAPASAGKTAAPANAREGSPVPSPDAQSGAVATIEAASVSEVHEPRETEHTGHRPSSPPSKGPGHNGDSDRVRISPLARRIASEKGIDISRLSGSGPHGRIIQVDIEAAIAQGARPARDAKAVEKVPAVQTGSGTAAAEDATARVERGQTRVIPMTKMRTAIAAALQRSKQQAPHFYETIDIDMERVVEMRTGLNERLKERGIRLSIMDFVYKAVAAALLRHPALNSRFSADKGQITQYGDVNLGIAVAIPDGLIVPVLRSADRMGLAEFRSRTVDLFERARGQRLKREEQSEGTFTVTALGSQGIRQFSAILNPPEVGILAIGSAEPRAVVRDGHLAVRSTMSVTLSCDHRVVDGATAADFLNTFRQLLEEPGMLLV